MALDERELLGVVVWRVSRKEYRRARCEGTGAHVSRALFEECPMCVHPLQAWAGWSIATEM